jgi:hypothetical protein
VHPIFAVLEEAARDDNVDNIPYQKLQDKVKENIILLKNKLG